MSEYLLQTHEFKGLQVTGYEKSFLEILAAKVLNPRAQKSDIQSEEKRLIHEASLRRHGELVMSIIFLLFWFRITNFVHFNLLLLGT